MRFGNSVFIVGIHYQKESNVLGKSDKLMPYGKLQQLLSLGLDYIRKKIIAGVITHSSRQWCV